MSDAGKTAAAKSAGGGEERVLLLLIASSPTMMDDLITALLDLGLSGATIIESKGMGALLREEMPIFAGLASMLPGHTGSRLIFSATTRKQADDVFTFIEKELKPAERPIAMTVPIGRFVGPVR